MDPPTKSRKTASSSTSPTKGVQKFYTKIRHKIEDIPPKITAKLNKSNGTPKSSPEHTKPTAPPRAAKRNRNQSGKKGSDIDKQSSSSSQSVPVLSSPYENIKISSNPNGLNDSDEECRISLNESTLSLEDEIFEELEKVAHDEAKLKAVLKNFDKILAEFNERNMTTSTPTLKMCYSGPSSDSQVVVKHCISKEAEYIQEKSKLEKLEVGGHKPLQKSKTCSIIESRCILKKSVSDPTDSQNEHMSLSDDFPHFKAFQVTKSLWNLQDFEEFAKTGRKMEKLDCKLPVLKTNFNTYKVSKCSTNSDDCNRSSEEFRDGNIHVDKKKLHKPILPKARSVWELSPAQNCVNNHSTCTRTFSGSKIPVMKTSPQKLAATGRSNSFCDQISTSKQESGKSSSLSKTVQVGRVFPTLKRTPPGKNTTVNKIVRNLNEINAASLNLSTSVKQPLIRTSSYLSVSSPTSKQSPNIISSTKRRSVISSASSTPHSLHKLGISAKSLQPTASSTISFTTGSRIKSANSELSLNTLKPPRTAIATKIYNNKTKRQQSDVLLNKCLQKGQDLLRKVEEFGSVTKLGKDMSADTTDKGHHLVSRVPAKRDIITKSQSKQPGSQGELVSASRNSPQAKLLTTKLEMKSQNLLPAKTYTVVMVNKKSNSTARSEEKIDNRLNVDAISPPVDTTDSPLKTSAPKIVYAIESSVQFPRLESCKIIPPILGHPSQQTAELLVSVKAMQQPLRIHQDSMLCINSDVLRSEKEYHSDCSDDSGHISNENDEMISSTVSFSPDGSGNAIIGARNQKGIKISELLEKFEPAAKEGSFNCISSTSTSVTAPEETTKKVCTTTKVAEVKPVKCITSSMEICPMYSSEVLFRSGILSQLEGKRDELLSDRIVQLQAYCRGYLARRRVAQRRVQELAVRCIQRNVKAFLAVRDWPWWRLLVRVTPLLNVHRTEEQLKIANDELQSLKAKLEKIENDRNVLKTENDKLEAKPPGKNISVSQMAPNPPATSIETATSITKASSTIKYPFSSNATNMSYKFNNNIDDVKVTSRKLLINGEIASSSCPKKQIGLPPVPPVCRSRKPVQPIRPRTPFNCGKISPVESPSESPIEVSLKLPVSKSSTSSDISNSYGMMHRVTSRESSIFSSRSPSPVSGRSGLSSSYDRYLRSVTPRRIFPQTYSGQNGLNIYEMQSLEPSPVVFDANLSFVLGCNKQPVRQTFRPSPSHTDPQTSSNYLTAKIQNFLQRTDHVMEEWKLLAKHSGRYDEDTISLVERQRERSAERGRRSRSVTNILIKGYQLSKSLPPTERSSSVAREWSHDDDDRTITEGDELSEMTVDLAEERSASNIATERLEAETGERLKLEKELQEQQHKVKNLQETSEKLEMELICAKSDLNAISEDEDADNEDAGGVYKLKYERVARELEFTKRRLQTQHEHDLEQLVGLKKQLEKKLADAYEEVEEQRQVVGQWKRKAQKMTNEMNDLRMLLEEQNGRNNLLEKKQRKFDSECQALQDAARQERQAKERLAREKDVLIAEKFTLEQNLADTRLELDLKEEKLTALQRELAEMTFGGGTEEEVAQLRRSKMDMDRRLKEQEEELDEMAGQVQLLEQAKLRLEMTLETMRKEARKEAQQRDDELEEARGSAYKKIKALECQLETEHEERTLLLREKHELERRLQAMEEQDRVDRSTEEAVNQKLRRDMRKYKALLKDAHSQLERLKADSPGKALIRQLRNQLEDAEAARSMAIKARQSAEAELNEVQSLLEEAQRARGESEDKATAAQRDRAELQAQIEENEEEMSELMKKYSQTVKQLNNEQTAISEAEIRISEIEAERNSLKEQVAELQTRLENIENMSDPSVAVQSKRLELRAKELESRLELEQATRARLEVQANRHKDALEKVQNEVVQSKMRELQSQESLKKSQKCLRELREEFHVISNREQECITRRKDLEKKLETVESEAASLRNDLRLALQRIADLQQAMEEGDDDVTESEESDSTDASLSDLEQRLRPIQVKRTSVTATKDTNGLDDSTTLVLRDRKADNSPRITVTSPSTTSIRDEALKNGDTSFA